MLFKPVMKPLYSSTQTGTDRLLGMRSLVFLVLILLIFFVVDSRGYRDLFSMYLIRALITLSFLSTFLFVDLLRFRQVRLRAYGKSLVVSGGAWPFCLFNRIVIKPSELKCIGKVLMLECNFFDGLDTEGHIVPGCPGMGKWKGWQAVIAEPAGGLSSAIAVVTHETKWLFGVDDPTAAVEKLIEIYDIKQCDIELPV
jgi:hypothetical protein